MSRLSPMRPFFILAPLGVLYLAILGRVVQLHASPDPVVNGVSGILHRETVLPAMRGSIVDRNGKPLAYDRPGYHLVMSSRWQDRRYNPDNRDEELTDDALATEIAAVSLRCKVPVEKMAKALLNDELTYTVVRRNLDLFEAQALQGYLQKYPGIGLKLESSISRVYPLGRTYGNLLGIVAEEEDQRSGASGLEFKFDEFLQGTAGSKGSQLVTGAFGVNPAKGLLQPEQGPALWTTLDADLGAATREILARSMVEHNPTWNGAVVMEAKTGALLALVGLPDFDPRDPWIDPETKLDNSGERSSFALAIENAVVPGSTFKPFVVGTAIDQGIIRRDEIFEDGGNFAIPGRKGVGNAYGVPPDPKTPEECLIYSSNVVSIRIGKRIGIPRFRVMLDRFGLWDPVIIGQRSMPVGTWPQEKDWQGRLGTNYTLVSLSFGHQIMVNPVRYAACFASLVNGGHRVEPHYLPFELGQSPDVSEARAKSRKGVERPISKSTSDFLVQAMEKMVENRLGNPLLEIEGVRWGGKSGTARNEVNKDLNTCVFAAFGPIPDPEIVVLVIVNWPQVKGRISGTRIAGPLAGEILRHALRTRGLLPDQQASRLDSASSNANFKPGLKEVR